MTFNTLTLVIACEYNKILKQIMLQGFHLTLAIEL